MASKSGPKLDRLPHGARDLALRALSLCQSGMAAQLALDQTLGEHSIPERERALCSELFYGSLRSALRTDFILAAFLKNGAKLPPSLLWILRLALYSMLFLKKQPEYAIVNWAVETARHLFGKSLSGLVNAVLRNFQRLGKDAVQLDFYKKDSDLDDLHALARFYSLPLWLAEFWREHYPDNYLNLMRRSFQRPRPALRLNRQRSESALIANEAARKGFEQILPWTFAAGTGFASTQFLGKSIAELQRQGLLSWQAAGSQVIMSELFSQVPRAPVWDACAGVGGKSLWLLENGFDCRLASDISEKRLMRIRDECSRLGLERPTLFVGSPESMSAWNGHILIDAPCSGLGVLARRPDILLHAREGRKILKKHLASQMNLLERAAAVISQGFDIIYISCTVNPFENEGQIEAFLRGHAAFSLQKTWQSPADHPWLEGMFGAVLRKN